MSRYTTITARGSASASVIVITRASLAFSFGPLFTQRSLAWYHSCFWREMRDKKTTHTGMAARLRQFSFTPQPSAWFYLYSFSRKSAASVYTTSQRTKRFAAGGTATQFTRKPSLCLPRRRAFLVVSFSLCLATSTSFMVGANCALMLTSLMNLIKMSHCLKTKEMIS